MIHFKDNDDDVDDSKIELLNKIQDASQEVKELGALEALKIYRQVH
jgi:hypothetical protein